MSQMKIYNIYWNSKTKEATTKNEEEGELVQGEKKHFDYLTFKYHIFFISCLF
jgi:hypothetical protein